MDIPQYFIKNTFDESLVLEFIYNADKRIVTLVCDYAYDALQAAMQGQKLPSHLNGEVYHRDIRGFTFQNVTSYEREIGSYKELVKYANSYSAKNNPNVVIQSLELMTQAESMFKIQIWFGYFGGCTFEFTDLEVNRKLIRSIGKSDDTGEWEYIDVETMQPVDFYKPF